MEVYTGSTEEKLIIASFNILQKEGINGATTKKIAQKANVSELTLFRKFKSKQKLIEAVKEYYCENLLKKLDETFQFNEKITVEDYLKNCFNKVVNLPDSELNIIKMGIEEVREIPTQKRLFLKISESVIRKLSEFFTLKIKQNEIRNVNPEILALNIFSILFETMILWKIYGKPLKYSVDMYTEDFLDLILNGIKNTATV